MLLAVDVHYSEETGYVAGVGFHSWTDQSAITTYSSTVTNIAAYTPGQFYKRELPCITQLLEKHALTPAIIIVDGYVHLPGGKAGLGKHLFDSLQGAYPIIGVAKNLFPGTHPRHELLRGSSQRPLYITSEGIATNEAKKHIAEMFGQNRIPALLKQVDRLARDGEKNQ